jgi:hypothetical protein
MVMTVLALVDRFAFAYEWSIVRLTNNNYGDYGVRIYQDKLTWQGYPQQDESEIFYYDGETVHQLTETSTYEFFPEISSGGIVWAGNISSWDGIGDVYFYDYNTITTIATNCVRKLDVDIFEDKIVWSDADTGQLMLYQGGNISPINGAIGWRPRMSSGGILYTFGDDYSPHLYLYDWNNIIDLGETTDQDANNDQPSQQINGNRVTWFKAVGEYRDNEVMLYDIPSEKMTQLTDGNIQYGQPQQPYVSGNYVAWHDHGNVGIVPLNLYDGQQIITVAESDFISVSTFFGDGFLVWAMRYNGQPDLFIYDLSSQERIQLTNDVFEEGGIVAYGNYVAYLSHDGDDSDIYLATIIPPESSITVTSPNGGEKLFVGDSFEITWRSEGDIDFVKIEYSVNNGIDWTEIKASTYNDGSYDWIVPNDISDQCQVRISDEEDEVSDVSNDVFSIMSKQSTQCSDFAGKWSGSWSETHCDGINYSGTWTAKVYSDCQVVAETNSGLSLSGTIDPSTGIFTGTEISESCGFITYDGEFIEDSVTGSYSYSDGGGGSFTGSLQSTDDGGDGGGGGGG